jgi:hypothetical protein
MAETKDMLAREIDEELRREQLLKIWEKYGTYILLAALVVVIGVGGYKYNEYRRTQESEATGDRFVFAIRDAAVKKTAEAQKAFEGMVSTGPAGYATLARLRLANAERAAGNTAKAAAAYDAIAKDANVDPLLADFAKLQGAMLRLDTASFTDIKNRLNPLTSEKNAWRYSARELVGLAAFKAGRLGEARTTFQRLLTDRTTPPGVTERARVMLAVVTEAEAAAQSATQKSDLPAKSEPAKEDKAKTADKKSN